MATKEASAWHVREFLTDSNQPNTSCVCVCVPGGDNGGVVRSTRGVRSTCGGAFGEVVEFENRRPRG